MKKIPDINKVISDFPEFAGIHPIANVFPMQQPEDFWELVENIKTTGVIHPLRREKGTNLLIDGRNRLIACAITGTLFEVDDIEPHRIYGLVKGDNFHSKKYDASQKAVIGRRLMPFYEAQAKERQREYHGNQHDGASGPVEKIPQVQTAKSRDAAGAVVIRGHQT